MPFSYKPLWKTLIDKDLSKKELMEKAKISKSTMDKMGRSENISMDILDRICSCLSCSLDNVVEYKENGSGTK